MRGVNENRQTGSSLEKNFARIRGKALAAFG
jgi:hypothetical protein